VSPPGEAHTGGGIATKLGRVGARLPGAEKIADTEGESALLLPRAIGRALSASSRIRYCFSLFQLAEHSAIHPDADVRSLRAEREACGLDDAALDEVAGSSRMDGGALVIPHAAHLHRVVTDAMEDMIALLAMSSPTAALAASFHERVQALLAVLPRVEDSRVPVGYVSQLTRPVEGQDCLHDLVAALHRAVGDLEASLAREMVGGATAYGIAEEDTPALLAFMRGVSRTSPLKFDHPGLAVMATRSRGSLVIQSDVGSGEAHLLVARVSGLECTLTHANPHLQTLKFFQGLFAGRALVWSEARSRESRGLADGEAYHRCTGRFIAGERVELESFLERVGSKIVFLLDWNRARKRLRNFLDGPGCIEVLRWAADQEVGHCAFLQLGGERLVFEAIESASPSPLRYGQRLDETLGRRPAIEFLEFMLRATSEGLLNHRSVRFIHDEIRADLSGRFETLEHGVLSIAAEHSRVIGQLARAVLESLGNLPRGDDDLRRRAADWESAADELVNRVRGLARHSPRAQLYARLLGEADDVADDLEEAAFLLSLPPACGNMGPARAPLLSLAALLVAGGQQWDKCLETAARVERGSSRDSLQSFLDAVDRVVTLERESDDAQRDVMTALFADGVEYRLLHLLTLVVQSFEHAADALSRCALLLRDHVLGDLTR
jgi:uncharacterized protein Yka (UPF0111/DUF47 family)